MVIGSNKPNPAATRRMSSDAVWPLRRADGRTWAEASAPKNDLPEESGTCPTCGGYVFFFEGERYTRCFDYECGGVISRRNHHVVGDKKEPNNA